MAQAQQQLRLLLVTETYPPEVNGVARTLERWARAFRERGHAVHVLRPRQPHEAADLEHARGWPLPFYPELQFGTTSLTLVRRLLRQSRTNLVHVATEGPLGWTAAYTTLCCGLPLVTSFHTNFDYYCQHYGLGLLEPLARSYLCWFHNRAAVTFTPSESTRTKLRHMGIRAPELWSRGVDVEQFHPRHRAPSLRRRLGLGEEDRLLLYVGRLAVEKNLTALLEAFAKVTAGGTSRVRLALVGGGPLAATLRAERPPGVLFPGVQQGRDLSAWYASADLFVFPSLSETFGNVVLEAMASGLPVVAFDAPAVNEIIRDGVNGLLVPCGGNLAETIQTLLQEEHRRRDFAAQARRTAEQRSWDAVFTDLEQTYLRLVYR